VLASWQNGVHLPEGTELEIADTPCELAHELAVPMLAADGSRNGHIAVASSRPIEATEDDKAVLAIFAGRAAAEVERRRQEESLHEHEAGIAASRMRIVQAAEDERGRIGRNLHDGAQQRLVAIGHFLDVARKKLGDAAPDAAPLVDRAREEAREAGRELRELARGLNPASLTERGLGVALATLGGNCPIPVEIDGVPDRRLPDPIETALYYLVSEALTNAAKHSKASAVRVSIACRDSAIVAEISDDGVGGAVANGGSGIPNLTDRIAALGGALSIDSPPGAGTRLVASIPGGPW
jgi:signal transduction histidine kinase